MGVKHLWELLSEVGRQISLEDLKGKVVAIDTSIWLMSFEAARFENGARIPNAHLRGLFYRICKLLFFDIKPVFVFDGKTLAAKRKTVIQRKNDRETQYYRTQAKKLLNQRLKELKKSGSKVLTPTSETPKSTTKPSPQDLVDVSRDLSQSFSDSASTISNESKQEITDPQIPDEDIETQMILLQQFSPDPEEEYLNSQESSQDISIDADSLDTLDKEALKSLPPDMQLEVLRNLKAKMKRKFRNQAKEVYLSSPTPNSFSEMQMNQFLKASSVTKELKRVSSQFNLDKKRRVASQDQEFILTKDTPEPQQPTPEPALPTPPEPPKTPPITQLGDLLSPSHFLFKSPSSTFSRQSSASISPIPPTKEEVFIDLSQDDDENEEDQVQFIQEVKKPQEKSIEISIDAKKPPKEEFLKLFLANPASLLDSFHETPQETFETTTTTITANTTSDSLTTHSQSQDENLFLQDDFSQSLEWEEEPTLPTPDPTPKTPSKDATYLPSTGYTLHPSPPPSKTPPSVSRQIPNLYQMFYETQSGKVQDPTAELYKSKTEKEIEIEALFLSRKDQERKSSSSHDDIRSVSQGMVSECIELLQFFGIPYVLAPYEAEAQCAFLNQIGLVDVIMTQDSDSFLFGATSVVKNVFKKDDELELYRMEDLEKRNLGRENLIKLAYLLGCDYTQGVKGVGVQTAREIVEKFPGENCLENFKKYVGNFGEKKEEEEIPLKKKEKKKKENSQEISKVENSQENSESQNGESQEKEDNFRAKLYNNLRKIRHKLEIPEKFPDPTIEEIFKKPQVNDSTEPFSWKKPDLVALSKFLFHKLGWNSEKIESHLSPVLERYDEKRIQKGTLDNFFPVLKKSVSESKIKPKENGEELKPEKKEEKKESEEPKGLVTDERLMRAMEKMKANPGGLVSKPKATPKPKKKKK